MAIYACPRCGSRRIRQGALHVGALTGTKDVCRDCNYQGIPLIFDTEKDYERFLKEIKTGSIDKERSASLSKNEREILSYAKEDIAKENEDLDKKPYGLIVLCGISIIYSATIVPVIIVYILFLFNISQDILLEAFNLIIFISAVGASILVIYGFLKRRSWTYTLSGILFIWALPLGLIFLYYLTRPHVKKYFKKVPL